MSKKRPKYRILLLLMLAGWLPFFTANAAPLPLPPGPLDTNLFNTNGLVLPPDVQFLLHDLQTNLDQLRPFLAIINGDNATNAGNNGAGPTTAMPFNSNTNATNAVPLIYGLGAALENVHTDIQDLLPRLAAMVGQSNYSGNPLSITTNRNNAVPNRFDTNSTPRQTPKFQKILFIRHSRHQNIEHIRLNDFPRSADIIVRESEIPPQHADKDARAPDNQDQKPSSRSNACSTSARPWALHFGPWTAFPF